MEEARQKVLEDLSDLFEVDIEALNDDFELDEELWDSLAIVTTVASVHKYYKLLVKGDKLEQCQKLGEVFKIIDEEKG